MSAYLGAGGVVVLSQFVATSPAWMIAAVAAGAFVIALLTQLPSKGSQKMGFEITALIRMFKKNYNEIASVGGVKIYLGALPNRHCSEIRNLWRSTRLSSVLSLNEDFEREPLGLSHPYSDENWERLGVTYQKITVKDHTLFSDDTLNEAADFIAEQVRLDRDIYVHCRAGNGRSAMAVAAYLIKYQKYTAERACKVIKEMRKSSTIYNKLQRLEEYQKTLSVAQEKK